MGSIKLFTVRGIDVKMHITFPLILVWGAVQFGLFQGKGLSGAAFGVVVTLILFACVVLHELGHSFVALHFGVEVRDILLLPLGGVAQMERIPENPIQELLISLTGPSVNLLIAGVLLVTGLLLSGLDSLLAVWDMLTHLGRIGWHDLMPYLLVTNLFLAGFNAIPAFPMDGGRVLRALLATVLPYGRATAIAVKVGRALAWMMGLWGFLGGGFTAVLIAIFIYIGAEQEGRMVQVKSALEGLRVRQAFSRRAQAIGPDEPLSRAVDLTLESFQSDFPVCDGERLVGLLTRTDLLMGLKHQGPGTLVRQVMRSQFPTARLDDLLFDVQQRMAGANLDALPVMEHDRFLGLVTRQDVEEVFRLLSARPGLLGTIRM